MLEINQEADPRATFQIEPHIGEELRSLIIQSTGLNFQRYVEQVGLQPNNVTNYLSGRNRISLNSLVKLLAGTDLNLTCTLQIQIENGSVVEDADSTPLDDMLYSIEEGSLKPDTQ